MKKVLIITIIVVFNKFNIATMTKDRKEGVESLSLRWSQYEEEELNKIRLFQLQSSVDSYLEKLSFLESSHVWDTINTFGYIGLYQLGQPALKDIGYQHITVQRFKSNPGIFPPDKQKEAVLLYMKYNMAVLEDHIGDLTKYTGKTINGVKITYSGLIAACHLGGVGNVIKFIEHGKNFEDGYGTSVIKYLVEMSNFNIKGFDKLLLHKSV